MWSLATFLPRSEAGSKIHSLAAVKEALASIELTLFFPSTSRASITRPDSSTLTTTLTSPAFSATPGGRAVIFGNTCFKGRGGL